MDYMNYSTAIFLISDAVRGINCVYEDGKHAKHYFFKTMDPNIEVGDLVIVPNDADNFGAKVVKVAQVDIEPDFHSRIEYKWIVGKLDVADHESIVAQEDAAIDKVKSAQKQKERRALRDALLADSEGNASSLAQIGAPLSSNKEAVAGPTVADESKDPAF